MRAEREIQAWKGFSETLEEHGLELKRGRASTVQINVGTLCNQRCRHCHLEAGPHRREVMDKDTFALVREYTEGGRFSVADITGGAPELHPHICSMIEELAERVPRVMLRTNLTALFYNPALLDLCRERKVILVASFPSLSPSQTDAQRGDGVLDKSVSMLKRLNEFGWGMEGSDLELHLVSNPAGAFLPEAQERAQIRFKRELQRRYGVQFHRLFTFANVPLGRFKAWLRESGNLEAYMQRLERAFNPCTIEGLMCRTLVSISWDGYLYDCDFNLACGIPIGGARTHVSQVDGPPREGSPISVGDHCYACAAGSGFT